MDYNGWDKIGPKNFGDGKEARDHINRENDELFKRNTTLAGKIQIQG